MKLYEARISVGPSTIRSYGPGVVPAAQRQLAKVHLRDFSTRDGARFARCLDRETERLRLALPRPARRWGVTRKLLNIFLRHSLYNQYLRREFGLASAEEFFEVPLDSIVAREIRSRFPPEALPRWRTVKGLTPTESCLYQEAASVIASHWGVARVHLDVYFWSGSRTSVR